MNTNIPEGFPARFGPEVNVSDIDLDAEEVVVGGARLTTQRAAALSARRESRSGRPSLTGAGEHSPSVTVRLPAPLLGRLDAKAAEQGARRSDVIRAAIEEYLAAS